MIRVTLWWGGPHGVAATQPAVAANPGDPAYDWAVYDRVALAAARSGIRVMFTVLGTPQWESGSPAWDRAPARASDLQAFAAAAARRYDGTFTRSDGTVLPRVRYWTAWNEPNSPVFLRPQYKRVGTTWVVQSARDYASSPRIVRVPPYSSRKPCQNSLERRHSRPCLEPMKLAASAPAMTV